MYVAECFRSISRRRSLIAMGRQTPSANSRRTRDYRRDLVPDLVSVLLRPRSGVTVASAYCRVLREVHGRMATEKHSTICDTAATVLCTDYFRS